MKRGANHNDSQGGKKSRFNDDHNQNNLVHRNASNSKYNSRSLEKLSLSSLLIDAYKANNNAEFDLICIQLKEKIEQQPNCVLENYESQSSCVNQLFNYASTREGSKRRLVKLISLILSAQIEYEGLKWLLSKANQHGFNPLNSAVYLENEDLVDLLLKFLKKYPDILSICLAAESKGHTILHSAINTNKPTLVRMILEALEKHKDILNMCLTNTLDSYTVLESAISSKDPEIVKLILKYKDPKILWIWLTTKVNRHTVLSSAINTKKITLVRMILEELEQHKDILDMCLTNTVNGYTALAAAISTEDPEIVKLVLKYMDPNISSICLATKVKGYAVLNSAIATKKPTLVGMILEALEKHKDILDMCLTNTVNGYTALAAAIGTEDPEIVELILKYSDPNISSICLATKLDEKHTTLSRAISTKKPTLVRMILEALKKHKDILNMCLTNKIDGYTVLDAAINMKDPEIVKLILNCLACFPSILKTCFESVVMHQPPLSSTLLQGNTSLLLDYLELPEYKDALIINLTYITSKRFNILHSLTSKKAIKQSETTIHRIFTLCENNLPLAQWQQLLMQTNEYKLSALDFAFFEKDIISTTHYLAAFKKAFGHEAQKQLKKCFKKHLKYDEVDIMIYDAREKG
ncbi:MAG: ankyrin repeat domain-containing protein, partial [Proteobacteria bacterium]|nr:ankyrin repeat domain-containing protein [Pseudomonadota bacterium]